MAMRTGLASPGRSLQWSSLASTKWSVSVSDPGDQGDGDWAVGDQERVGVRLRQPGATP